MLIGMVCYRIPARVLAESHVISLRMCFVCVGVMIRLCGPSPETENLLQLLKPDTDDEGSSEAEVGN